MKMLIKRNLKLFFRDKANVFFSMLAVLIVIILFVVFLADIMVNDIERALPHASSVDVSLAVAGLVLAGTIAVATVSSSLGGTARVVIDKEDAAKDFLVSPISRTKLMFSYVISSGIIGFIMSGLALVTTIIYLILIGGGLPSFNNLALLILTLFLGILSANSMVFLITCFVKSESAHGSLSTIIGTLIGFLTGVYLPIGQLPSGVAWVIRLFPISHTASMFRQILAQDALESLFENAPASALSDIQEFFGVTFSFGSYTTNFLFSATVLLSTSVVFYIIGLYLMKKQAFIK